MKQTHNVMYAVLRCEMQLQNITHQFHSMHEDQLLSYRLQRQVQSIEGEDTKKK